MGIFHRLIDHIKGDEPALYVHEEPIEKDMATLANHYQSLLDLQNTRQLLEVLLPNVKNSFQSMIIDIDLAKGCFSLDAFSPQLEDPEQITNQHIIIRHTKDWQVLEIQSRILTWNPEQDCYQLLLPEWVDYQPRRNQQRLLLSQDNILNVTINPLYGAPWYATVKDISLGGMRVNLSGDLRSHLHRDKILPKCQIILDSHMTIVARGEVKSFSYISKPYRHTEISIEFEGMSHKHLSDLKHFLDYIEVAA